MNSKFFWILLFAVMALASFARIWQIDSIPPGLWPDEALNGVQAIYEPGKIFYPENQGREGLMMLLNSLSFQSLGISMFSFRLVPAIMGILTVLGVFLLAFELFRKKSLALLASFFVAVSFWHINFSRINFRAIIMPLVLSFSFYFLFLGIRKKNWRPFLLSGIIFGIGFYTYTPFRLAPAILFLALFLWWLAARKEGSVKNFLQRSFLMLLAVFFTALPIGLYFLSGHMQDFFGRTGGISVFSQPNPFFAFLESMARHLAMFNIYGDPNMRHNYSGDPQLFWPVGLLFLIGFYLLSKKGWKALKEKKWMECLPYATLFVWFFIMILPGALTYEGLPHSLRVIGIVPAVYIIAALGGIFVFEKLKSKIKSKKILAAIVIIFLACSAFFPLYRYFYQWGQNPETENAFSKELVLMGNYLKNSPFGYEKYVIIYGGDLPVQTVKMIALTGKGNEGVKYLWPHSIDGINTKNPALILMMENNQNDLLRLIEKYPNGALQVENKLWIYKININNL
ncbi:MAG: glycosyltransferase family 39 protein [Candidatus Paceibacterota bacterium]|jgi:4-amino-4-deoxy-L-arabinose transferase-like glycosyltransferase